MWHAGSDVMGCRRPTGGVFKYVSSDTSHAEAFPVATPRGRSSSSHEGEQQTIYIWTDSAKKQQTINIWTDSAKKQQTINIWTDSAKKQQTINIWTDSAKKQQTINIWTDSAKKQQTINIWTDSAKKQQTIYIWTVHIYRLYRRQCAKYTYIYSVHIVYYKDTLNYQRHIIHHMGTSTLCTVSIHNVVYT